MVSELIDRRPEGAPIGQVRIIATSDLHGSVLPYDYYLDQTTPPRGLAALAPTIARLRQEVPASVLVDNGDALQGNPMADAILSCPERRAAEIHPIIEMMNDLNYDAVTPGNHEFNFGLAALKDALRHLQCPVITSNATLSKDATPLGAPHLILDRTVRLTHGTSAPIRIGFFGVLPPQTMVWDRLVLEGALVVSDMVDSATRAISHLKAAGADIVVGLCHTGPGDSHWSPMQENVGRSIAALNGLDALILGHTHQLIPSHLETDEADIREGCMSGTATIMPGVNGVVVGTIDLTLEKSSTGWTLIGSTPSLHPAQPNAPEALHPSPSVARAHAGTLSRIRAPVGKAMAPINSFFSLIANCPSLQIVCDAQREFVENALADTPWSDLPILSAAAPFRSGGWPGPDNFIDIPAGEIAIRHAAKLYIFPNTACAAVFTGQEVINWLERSAAMFCQINPRSGAQPLIDRDVPSYNFDVLDGLTYEIDVSQPSRFDPLGDPIDEGAQRIHNLRHEGSQIDPEQRFIVASNSYRIGGGGHFFNQKLDRPVFDFRTPLQSIVVDYVRNRGSLEDHAHPTWSFTPIVGASGSFLTSPKARHAVDAIKDRTILGFDDVDGGWAMGRLAFD